MIELYPYLTQCRTFEEMTSRFITALKGAGPDEVNMSIVLKEYLHKESQVFLNFVEKQKLQIFEALNSILPCDISVYGRKKAFYSYVNKLQEAEDVRDVKDIYAIRIVIDDSLLGIESAIQQCYISAKALIKYYQDKGYTPETLREKGVTGELDDGVEIYIPTEDIIPNFICAYRKFLKDYIANPKSNGYQSLHLRFQKDGKTIDVQIRTSTMDVYSESGGASHEGIYKPPVDYDFLKNIHIDGLEYDNDANILRDDHGIFRPLPIGKVLNSKNAA